MSWGAARALSSCGRLPLSPQSFRQTGVNPFSRKSASSSEASSSLGKCRRQVEDSLWRRNGALYEHPQDLRRISQFSKYEYNAVDGGIQLEMSSGVACRRSGWIREPALRTAAAGGVYTSISSLDRLSRGQILSQFKLIGPVSKWEFSLLPRLLQMQFGANIPAFLPVIDLETKIRKCVLHERIVLD